VEYIVRKYEGLDRKIFCNLPKDRRAQKIESALPGYIYPVSHEIWKFLNSQKNWDCVVDVGSNYGEFLVDSLVAFSEKKQVQPRFVCIEPSKSIIPYLKRTLSQFNREIELHECVLSSEAGEILFRDSKDFSGGSRILEENAPNGHDIQIYPVVSETLDRLAGGESNYLVKIDVEGHEIDVIKGCKKIIQEADLCIFFVEMNHISPTIFRSVFTSSDIYLFSRYRGRLIKNPRILRNRLMISGFHDLYLHDGLLVFGKLENAEGLNKRILTLRERVRRAGKKIKWAQTGSNRRPTD
jgi:FkbM family methyltransferase